MPDKTLLSSSPSATPEGQRQRLSVLVVESDSQILNQLRDTLHNAGYEVFSETSSERVRQRDDLASFAIVLLDRQLDQDLLPHIRQMAPMLPIILMSPQGNVREAATALSQGASDYLIKPIPPAVLRMSLEQVLAQTRAEVAFQQERAFSDNLLEIAPAIILLLDTQGRIIRFNPFLEELTGYRLAEVQGQDWFEMFLSEEDRPQVRETTQQILSGGSASVKISPIITQDGQRRRISWHWRAVTDEKGNLSGLLAIGQDVTDLLLDVQKKKERTGRLAAIGQTIASVSHEARNVLYALKMGLDLLRHSFDDRDKALEIIQEMENEQHRLARLFEDVRGFAAPIQLERSPHNLSEIWQKAWTSLEGRREGRDAVLHEEVFAPKITCVVDGFRLEEVFRNLFENSLAACADPVEIHITCTPTKVHGEEAVSIRVRDNGPGLTPDQQEKIFEAFYTTKSGGTGLGMALTKRIIKAHGGTIAVEPESTGGAGFLITLPVAGDHFNSSSSRNRKEVKPGRESHQQ